MFRSFDSFVQLLNSQSRANPIWILSRCDDRKYYDRFVVTSIIDHVWEFLRKELMESILFRMFSAQEYQGFDIG